MYKITNDPPAGNTIVQMVEHKLVEVAVRLIDNRKNPDFSKPEKPEDIEEFVLFIEYEEEEGLWKKVSDIVAEKGYTLYGMSEPKRITYQYDAGIAFIRAYKQ